MLGVARRRRGARTALVTGVTLGATLLAGCGSDAPAAPTSAPSSSGGGWSLARINAALLTGPDVGGGYTARADTAPATPLPCEKSTAQPLVQARPPVAYLARVLVGSRAAVKETVYSYRTAQQAVSAVAAARSGLHCASGTLYSTGTSGAAQGETVRITALQQPALAVDESAAWTFRTADVAGELVVARIGALMMTLTFEAPTGTVSSALPDADAVTRTAVGKLT